MRPATQVLVTLHPDKVQQRGGTVEQRYVADLVFDVLRNAHTAFMAGAEGGVGAGGPVAMGTVIIT